MCLLQVLANGGGVEIFCGVLESSLSDLEEEGLDDGVSSPEWGSREEAHLSGQNWGLSVLNLDSFEMEGEREPRRI